MTRPDQITGAQCGSCGTWIADCEALNDAGDCARCVSEQEEREESSAIRKIVERACWDYADGLNRGPVSTRPARREAAITVAVAALLKEREGEE